ncbi:MAG: PhzF family phenazine biosynthesis protein [Chloroflexota bacterium]|nr:PhzF family phenazine biosynthesis protein [Chloroflexota bacterium]
MTRVRAVRHVDAFTTAPLTGNPAAVVDGDGLDAALMQRIALNQHLSETVFLLPPAGREHHARLRIFTPRTELPFAGHPTIAAAHILTEEGHAAPAAREPLRLETGAGVIPVAIEGTPPLYTMTQAPPEFRASPVALDAVAAALGLPPGEVVRGEEVSTGIFWLIAQVASLDAMLRVRPDALLLRALHLAVFCVGAEADVHVRAFALPSGIAEDPVTGSANGCIAAFIARHALMRAQDGEIRYVAEQGAELGQPGRVRLRVTGVPDALSVEVGGHAVTVLRGELLLPDA